MKRRPILTPKRVAALRAVRSVIQVELEAGAWGAFENGGPGCAIASPALEYIDELLDWYDARREDKRRDRLSPS